MRTYRELFRTAEFTPLFLASSAQTAAQTLSGLALGTLIFTATGSPLLSALAMFGPALAQVVGAATLLSAADRLPARAAVAGLGLFFAAATAVQAIPGLPVAGNFAVVTVVGVIGSLGGGVRYGLLNEIVDSGGYLLGRSVLNMATGAMQILGFGVGGALLTMFSPRGVLLVGAGLYLTSATFARLGLSARPPRAGGRPSPRETWRDNALLWSAKPRRYIYLALWVPNGLVAGCESLFVSYSPRDAGALFASVAFGMLLGDTAGGRFLSPAWRQRLSAPLLVLLAAPFLVFVLRPALVPACAAVALGAVGYGSSLLLTERLMALTPDRLSGHALGLHSSGMLTFQGLSAALAGAVAQATSPAAAITVLAAASLVVTAALAPGLATRPALEPEPEPVPAV